MSELEPSANEATTLKDQGWLQQIGENTQCPSCDATVEQNFCPNCGQKLLRHRLRLPELLQELFSKLFNHERGVFFTFWSLLVRPGQVVRDYVSGKQKPYVSPLTFYFIGAAIQLLSLWLNLGYLRQSLIQNFNTSLATQPANVTETLAEKLGDNVGEVIADSYLNAIQQGYTYVALFCFCLPWAVLLCLGNRLWRTHYRLAETVVFSLYVFGQVLILTAITGLLLVRLNLTLHGVVAMSTYVLFPLWAHRRFFPATWSSRLTTLAATLVCCGTFLVSIIVVFICSMVLRVLLS